MALFRERNKTNTEYSGHQEASKGLRERLLAVCSHYMVSRQQALFAVKERRWVNEESLNHELRLQLNRNTLSEVVFKGTYDEVFEGIEIFLGIAQNEAYYSFSDIKEEIKRVFRVSGSVYSIGIELHVELAITNETARDITSIRDDIFSEHDRARNTYLEGVSGLIARTKTPMDSIKAMFVAFEDYLKSVTGAKTFAACLSLLERRQVISPNQKALIEKIQSYSSDTYGVRHAGASMAPGEVDALWFLDTVNAQLKLLHSKTCTFREENATEESTQSSAQ